MVGEEYSAVWHVNLKVAGDLNIMRFDWRQTQKPVKQATGKTHRLPSCSLFVLSPSRLISWMGMLPRVAWSSKRKKRDVATLYSLQRRERKSHGAIFCIHIPYQTSSLLLCLY